MKNTLLKSAQLVALGMMISASTHAMYTEDLSEKESVWQAHGFASKKQAPALTQDDLASLFKTGSVAGKAPQPWRLEGNVEKPSEIISRIALAVYPQPFWMKDESYPLICTRQEGNIIEYVTELTFMVDEDFPWLFYEKVPYRLILTKSKD